MRQVGKITELWRYPVSSVTGELLERAEVSADGLAGDRRFALVEVSSGIVAHPERDRQWQKCVFVKSRTTSAGTVEVKTPDHDWRGVNDPHLALELTDFFGFDVALRPYERARAGTSDVEVAKDRYQVSPLHLLTSASIDHLKSIHPAGDPDRRRFRPNIVVETSKDITGFAELDWIDKGVRLGEVEGTVIAPTKRCGFTIIEQDGLPNDPEILRNIMRFGRRNMGVYCAPAQGGVLKVGDLVNLDQG
ncbi:hypothetical protein A6U87_08955 [Rhizobium sp. AC44/96]|uniref:MOSC domain-containing protein n=1 Tax=Rhizobium sp. AC44/96 TaxID=1841654 RepID=UPI00080FA79E|nr:MOSC N-terminal beta barrel domain-containing protein [Rhizobium sp. AC44/96]OCJ08987.1 hypothetical protein A6U87_08955 [Rhizobium sp. AC44/96]